MKSTLVVLLGCLLSVASFAGAANLDITGKPARRLLINLQKAGAFVDCGAGTCGTEAKNVQCLVKGNSSRYRRFSCTMVAQSESGSLVAKLVTRNAARSLYRALLATGLEGNCGMGTCGVSARAIQCLVHGNSVNLRTYECAITP